MEKESDLVSQIPDSLDKNELELSKSDVEGYYILCPIIYLFF